ncbi:MAG: SurA N-terminal domain-containing protein, partial [Vampirovibrionales bacterium]|nr:SurA N-terminal domain-containing protein [Vampirovibrionales bacterium]
MFDAVRNNKRVAQGILALITVPFALWGVESYVRNASSGAGLATVGQTTISEQEFQAALRDQGERMQ